MRRILLQLGSLIAISFLIPICGSAQITLQKTKDLLARQKVFPSADSLMSSTPMQLSASYWYKEGLFCEWEDRIMEKSKVPISFRLGTLDYTDNIEYNRQMPPLLPRKEE